MSFETATPTTIPADGMARVWASVLDWAILGLFFCMLWALLFIITLPLEIVLTLFGLPGVMTSGAVSILSIVILAAFYASPWQATPGKRMMNLRVTNADGERLNFVQALIRVMAKALSMPMFIVFLISGVMLFIHPEKRAIHDLVASTRVLKGKAITGDYA